MRTIHNNTIVYILLYLSNLRGECRRSNRKRSKLQNIKVCERQRNGEMYLISTKETPIKILNKIFRELFIINCSKRLLVLYRHNHRLEGFHLMCEIIQINYRVNVDEWHVFLNLALDLKIIFQSCYLLFVWPKGMSRRRRRKLGVFIRSSVIGWMVCWLDVSSGCRTHSPSSSSTPKVELE